MTSLYATGNNSEGQLGFPSAQDEVPNFTHVPLPFDVSEVVSVSCGANHTLVVVRDTDGILHLLGSGSNKSGQLGPGPENFSQFSPLKIPSETTGLLTACVVDTSVVVVKQANGPDLVMTWGSNNWMLCGVESRGAQEKSNTIAEMDNIVALAAGARHVVLAVAQEGHHISFYGWGASRKGQLGQSLALHRHVPFSKVTDFPTDLISGHVQLSAGYEHTVICVDQRDVHFYGSNTKGQLGPEGAMISYDEPVTVQCSWKSTFIHKVHSKQLDQFGALYSSGERTLDDVEAFAAGSEHIVFVKDGSVHVRGWNEHGNLGLGHQIDVDVPVALDWGVAVHPLSLWGGQASSWVSSGDKVGL